MASEYFTDTYGEIYAVMKDWMNYEGGQVSDLVRDTINRAQKRLWERRVWDYLLKTATLTISSNSASLPSDFGRVWQVYLDTNGDGQPDYFFYRNSRRVDDRCEIVDTFSMATGHSFAINFAMTPNGSPVIKYQAALSDMSASGNYSYFPGHLVILQAQLIHITEKGIGDSNEYQGIKNALINAMWDYESCHQYQNNDMRLEINDDNGEMVETSYSSLVGDEGKSTGVHSNDYDMG